MPTDIREFQIRTPDRAVGVIRGSLRDAVLEIHRSLSMSRVVVSAYLDEDTSRPLVTGYMDGLGRIEVYRYLNSASGTEFENWLDADRHQIQSLPDGAWTIKRFVGMAPPSVVLGEAVLRVPPHELPRVDFALESGMRRMHYGPYLVDATPLQEIHGWTAHYVIRDGDGRALGPIGIHTYYESFDRALEMALSFAETMIDGGITLPELEPQRKG